VSQIVPSQKLYFVRIWNVFHSQCPLFEHCRNFIHILWLWAEWHEEKKSLTGFYSTKSTEGEALYKLVKSAFTELRVRSFGLIWIRISDPRSLGSWCIKGTDESTQATDSSVPLINHDPSDLGSLNLIQVTPKERTLNLDLKKIVGKAFDGAANRNGLDTQGTLNKNGKVLPLCIYIHCYGHVLNLALQDTMTQIEPLRNVLGTIQAL